MRLPSGQEVTPGWGRVLLLLIDYGGIRPTPIGAKPRLPYWVRRLSTQLYDFILRSVTETRQTLTA